MYAQHFIVGFFLLSAIVLTIWTHHRAKKKVEKMKKTYIDKTVSVINKNTEKVNDNSEKILNLINKLQDHEQAEKEDQEGQAGEEG